MEPFKVELIPLHTDGSAGPICLHIQRGKRAFRLELKAPFLPGALDEDGQIVELRTSDPGQIAKLLAGFLNGTKADEWLKP